MFLLFYTLGLVICILSCFLFVFISYSFFLDEDDKLYIYECGFYTFDMNDCRIFDFNFFCIAILFLLVELEIFLLFFWILSFSCFVFCSFFLMLILFFFLFVGYVYLDLMLFITLS